MGLPAVAPCSRLKLEVRIAAATRIRARVWGSQRQEARILSWTEAAQPGNGRDEVIGWQPRRWPPE